MLLLRTLALSHGSHDIGATSHDKQVPAGGDEERVRHVIAHDGGLSDDALAAEIEATLKQKSQRVMGIPNDRVPAVRALLPESSDAAPASPAA